MIIPYTPRGHDHRHQRWAYIERAALFDQEGDRHAPGVSQRQAAQGLDVPRAPRRVSRGRGLFSQRSQSRLPAPPGHCGTWGGEVGAGGMRLGCLFLTLTGLHRFGGASYGTPQQGNRCVEEALVAYRQEERALGS